MGAIVVDMAADMEVEGFLVVGMVMGGMEVMADMGGTEEDMGRSMGRRVGVVRMTGAVVNERLGVWRVSFWILACWLSWVRYWRSFCVLLSERLFFSCGFINEEYTIFFINEESTTFDSRVADIAL